MRIVSKKPIALALWGAGATFIASAAVIFFLTPHERLASVLNVIGCVFVIIHSVYRMRYDPAYRNSNPFDRDDVRLF
jgi:hypothetical protein